MSSIGRDTARRIHVADAVVEQLQIELLDPSVNDQVIDVGEFSDHADRAAGNRTGEWRQPRLEEPRRTDRADVFENLSVSSASIWSVNAIRPEPDMTRRGDAASTPS